MFRVCNAFILLSELPVWEVQLQVWLLQDSSGAISSEKLLGVMRTISQNPTEDELNTLIMEVDLDGNGTIQVYWIAIKAFVMLMQIPEFLEMMKTKANEVDQGAELRYNVLFL